MADPATGWLVVKFRELDAIVVTMQTLKYRGPACILWKQNCGRF